MNAVQGGSEGLLGVSDCQVHHHFPLAQLPVINPSPP